MCDFARASRRRYAAGGLTNSVGLAARIRTLARRTHVFWLLLACLAVLPSQVQAQEAPDHQETPDRFVLEAGIVGGNSVACPGRYVGINGRVAGPVSLYGMVETYRCADRAGSANRIGASVLLGRSSWLVRPALRTGIEYDGGDDVWPALRGTLHPSRRRRVRRHGSRALPDGRIRLVLSPNEAVSDDGCGSRAQAKPRNTARAATAREKLDVHRDWGLPTEASARIARSSSWVLAQRAIWLRLLPMRASSRVRSRSTSACATVQVRTRPTDRRTRSDSVKPATRALACHSARSASLAEHQRPESRQGIV